MPGYELEDIEQERFEADLLQSQYEREGRAYAAAERRSQNLVAAGDLAGAAVQAMRQELVDRLEVDEVLFGDAAAFARTEAEAGGLLRMLQMLEDDFGVLKPWPSFSVKS